MSTRNPTPVDKAITTTLSVSFEEESVSAALVLDVMDVIDVISIEVL